MKMSAAKALEGTDRLRGLARAAWARLKRGDLGDKENAAAQEEYARCRDELLDVGYPALNGLYWIGHRRWCTRCISG